MMGDATALVQSLKRCLSQDLEETIKTKLDIKIEIVM
jgi:hypothetical protein